MYLSHTYGSNKKRYHEVDPDEVFADAVNISKFDGDVLEGKFEKPLSKISFLIFSVGIFFILGAFFVKAFITQVHEGDNWSDLAKNNYLKNTPVFAYRGVIKDRNGVLLAWNDTSSATGSSLSIPARRYINDPGFSHVLGYVSYPKKDKTGYFWQTEYIGADGLEKQYNNRLAGKQGELIVEVSARGQIQNDNIIKPPIDGETLNTHIDSRVQKIFFNHLKEAVDAQGFSGGVGIMMDVNNGEIIAMTSYPEYSNNIFINASTTEEKEKKAKYLTSSQKPMLNRAVSGQIVPGSTVKPFMAYAALNEGVIDEFKNIYSSGQLVIKNVYGGPDTIFKDWKAHGYTDIKKAIAESSDEFFYQVGGGYKDQPGLGISRIERYMKMFGFASSTGVDLPGEKSGVVPSPEWKKKNFKEGDWLLGNTYHTSIGQYGFQTTPLELVRSISILGNGGTIVTPHIVGDAKPAGKLTLDSNSLRIVRQGMRMTAEEGGTAHYFNDLPFKVAAKTGTAQLGYNNERVNSWSTGYFPYENPKYAFVYVMESGPASNTLAASKVMRAIFGDILTEAPEYTK
jgi:penicillin-binding protein 2